ncbi:MAG: monofunctional biosynthetic peptidoglycan transglycosylase [Corallincola sp.]|nr:monofunctional biosynthetic peptidoglycan transglycosylase [Corallincola sp.]
MLSLMLPLPDRHRLATFLRTARYLAGRALLWFVGLSVASVMSLWLIDPPLWGVRLERALLPPSRYPDEVRHQWVDLDEISSNMQLAVIAAEDQRYPHHWGFDLNAMAAAFKHNERSSRVRGASTLSQQTAKNLYLCSWRSYIRKALEAWFTLLMELLLSKERILEIYLNIVEFGPGIYGVEAAAQHYFHTSAARLSRHQAALLAAVLPNPYRFNAGAPSGYVQRRANWIARQMRQLGNDWLQRL